MKLPFTAAWLLAGALGVFACSSSSSPVSGDPGPDGGGINDAASSDGGATDAEDAACNSLTQHGPSVEIYETSTTPFVPTSGTILDGTYLLTSGQRYATDNVDAFGDVIATLHGTIEVTGTVVQTVTTTGAGETRSTLTMSKDSSGALLFTTTCQSPAGDAGTVAAAAGTYRYSVSTDEIILELQVSNGVVLTQRYTRM